MEECSEEITSVHFQLREVNVVQTPHEEQLVTRDNNSEDNRCIWVTSNDEYMIGVKKIKLSSNLENENISPESQQYLNIEHDIEKKLTTNLLHSEIAVDNVEFQKSEGKILLGEAANGKKIYGRIVNIRPSEYSHIQIEDTNGDIETQIIQEELIEHNEHDKMYNDSQLPNIDENNILDENLQNNGLASLPRYNKMYIGKTINGRKIYGRVIDFKSADGREITDEKKINEMSCKIKGGLAQIIVSEAIALVPQEKECSNSKSDKYSKNKFGENSNLILDNGQSQSSRLSTNDREGSSIENNDTETDKELEDVREILKTLLSYLDLTSPNYQSDQILQKKLRIIKAVTSKGDDGGNNPKEYIFTGKMHGSFESGWEFLCQPEIEDSHNDFFTIQISIDEKSDKFGVNYVIEFNKNTNRAEEAIQNSSDPIEELFKLSETKKINGKKHYECAICKKPFYGLIHFKRHIKVHCANGNGAKSALKCPLCDCIFSHDSTRTRHIVKVHREEGTVYAF